MGLAWALFVVPLAAQELRWQLPARGAALYKRTLQVDETVEPKQAWIPGVWQGEAMFPAVLAGELGPDRQRRVDPAYDPRDLLADIAFDLGVTRPGKLRVSVETFDRFHPLQVDVVLGEPAADGTQSIEAVLEVDAKAARVASTNPNIARLRGKLRGQRVIDRGKGLVTGLAGPEPGDPVHGAGERHRSFGQPLLAHPR